MNFQLNQAANNKYFDPLNRVSRTFGLGETSKSSCFILGHKLGDKLKWAWRIIVSKLQPHGLRAVTYLDQEVIHVSAYIMRLLYTNPVYSGISFRMNISWLKALQLGCTSLRSSCA